MNIRCLRPLLAAALASIAGVAIASPSGVVISQIYGGGGNSGASYKNDFIELHNTSTVAVTIDGWSVQYAAAAQGFTSSTTLSGVIQPGQFYLIQESTGANGTVDLPTPDSTGTIAMSATAGKVALVRSTTLIGTPATATSAPIEDFIGFGSTANLFEGSGPAPGPSNTLGDLRSGSCTDTDNNASDFATAAPTPRNSSTLLVCGAPVNAPIVASCPAFAVNTGVGGSGTYTATDADGIVTTVNPTTSTAGITTQFAAATAVGGTATLQVSVAATVPAGNYSLTAVFGNAQSQSASCTGTITVNAPTALVPIYNIQGSGTTSPVVGQTVTTSGVVTKVMNAGFFLQDPTGDGNPATSDGIYVFTSTAPTVSAGQLVQLTGLVSEFNTGAATNTDTAAHTVTELSNISGLVVLGTGSVSPVTVTMPLANRDDMERYEGMVVSLTGPFTIGQNYFLGRYGQLSMSVLGRLESPTNKLRPGQAALAMEDDNLRRLIILDDGSTAQNVNPTPYIGAGNTVRAGDTVETVVGVIDYGLTTSANTDPGNYKIQPIVAPTITRTNPRTTTPDDVGGNIRVAAANVLNFFTTFTNGQTASGQTGQGCALGGSVSAGNCRGADSLAEFQRQLAKIVEELAGLNADVVGIMELQNNGEVAVQTLVNALNARLGAQLYEVVPAPVQGTGTDAIRVGMIYKPSKLQRVGPSVSNTDAINNRPPFAQTFAAPTGDKFTLVVNHLKSKSSCPTSGPDADNGDLQGCWNATRVQQATALRNFVTGLQASSGTNDVLMVGDFNSLAQEDPIAYLTGTAGYVDQIGRFNTFGYSYVFDSEAGRLDHAIATPTLSTKVTKATEWHVNADEPQIIDYNLEFKQPACATCGPDYYSASPYRASDHDPVLIGIQFGTTSGKTIRTGR